MTERELALRREIMLAFAETGAPPAPPAGADPAAAPDATTLRALAAHHVVHLDDDCHILMAHPFAAPGAAARVESGGRTWWGSCAWDGLGIVAALGLENATVQNNGLTLHVRAGEPQEREFVFHVAVPARHWWDDIVHT